MCQTSDSTCSPPGSFPGVLQEICVLSGRRRSRVSEVGELQMVEHDHRGGSSTWAHVVAGSQESWSRYLLTPPQLEALKAVRRCSALHPLGALAVLEVSIVTGANDYFSADNATVAIHDLRPWAKRLLPRMRHAPGLIFDLADHRRASTEGVRSWLIHFSEDSSDPLLESGARTYIERGEELGLHTRYKCRIRAPWYRVPGVRTGRLLLSKRSIGTTGSS